MPIYRSKPFRESFNDQQARFERSFGYPFGYRPTSKEINKMNSQLWRNSITANQEQQPLSQSMPRPSPDAATITSKPMELNVDLRQQEKLKKLKEMGLL